MTINKVALNILIPKGKKQTLADVGAARVSRLSLRVPRGRLEFICHGCPSPRQGRASGAALRGSQYVNYARVSCRPGGHSQRHGLGRIPDDLQELESSPGGGGGGGQAGGRGWAGFLESHSIGFQI